ncbi:hypothetical protein RB619_06285 [Flavobacterium sp. LHD-80]|uniref:hypothetical protein n=1 Tax=Flavobacterium sp. LHD-80 TaxID=3071411 RepID=UPI0027DFAB4E|nr:hypothetical protein [Flavobacterium sp. LHD-80]MDQ6470245.1 hypothetical protein [Flavobacterium sp. LHD-80]
MLKKIFELHGAAELSKEEQRGIKGGNAPVCEENTTAKRCPRTATSPAYWICVTDPNEPCE